MKVYVLWVQDFNIDGEWELEDIYSTEETAKAARLDYLDQYDGKWEEDIYFEIEERKIY